MELEKILVIEDNEKHIEDAKNLLEDRIKIGAIEGVDYTTNLEDAMEYLKNNKYSGVLSDVFFPSYEGGNEEENGTKIGEYALERGLPITLITSTYHHGRKTEPVNQWVRERSMSLIDANPQDNNGEASTKDWTSGYSNLMFLIGSKSNENIEINSEGISGSIIIDNYVPFDFIMNEEESFIRKMFYYAREGMFNSELEKISKEDPKFKEILDKYYQGMFEGN